MREKERERESAAMTIDLFVLPNLKKFGFDNMWKLVKSKNSDFYYKKKDNSMSS